jgi:hypothetical protein
MSDAVDPLRLATDAVFAAMLDARRAAGDASICDALDQLGAGAGQNRYRYAAAALRGLPPGRPAIDDDWALQRILKFPPIRRRGAVSIVARAAAGDQAGDKKKVATIARRLRQKLVENEKNKAGEIVLSVSSIS